MIVVFVITPSSSFKTLKEKGFVAKHHHLLCTLFLIPLWPAGYIVYVVFFIPQLHLQNLKMATVSQSINWKIIVVKLKILWWLVATQYGGIYFLCRNYLSLNLLLALLFFLVRTHFFCFVSESGMCKPNYSFTTKMI